MKERSRFVPVFLGGVALLVGSSAVAANYTYELSTEQPWANSGTSSTSAQTVTVRSYVPGSNTTTYSNITIYTPTYTSEANALGDVVGTVYSIYGSGNTAWVDPYDGAKRTVIYPDPQIMHTQLNMVNDQRIAAGNYYLLGGSGRSFIYDVIYDQFMTLRAPNATWTNLSDLNNGGQIVGMQSNDGGYTRTGFIYDCVNGYQNFVIPGASWTVPVKVDDQGNIYGYVSGIADATYFIAHPDSPDDLSSCQLFPRDDVPPPVAFGNDYTFEMSGDFAKAVKVADFDGGGIDDLLVYHEPGKTILYLGENGFTKKVRYTDNVFSTLSEGVVVHTQWDFNNDGFYDKVKGSRLYLSKPDGSFYYVPQQLPGYYTELPQTASPFIMFGDFNGDALVDIVRFDGAFATISYQIADTPVPALDTTTTSTSTNTSATTTTTSTTTTSTDPAVTSGSSTTTTDTVPAISPYAEQVELERTVSTVNHNNVILTSGETLWISVDTVITYNDSTGFEPGQLIQFKAWKNPDAALIGISIELP